MRWVVCVLLFAGCQGATSPPVAATGWKLIENETFSFRAPADFVEKPVQGIDSFVGTYENQALILGFDYGQYSNSLDDYKNRHGFKSSWLTIDGKRARLVNFESHVAIHFPVVKQEGRWTIRLTMEVEIKEPSQKNVAEEILRRIRFK